MEQKTDEEIFDAAMRPDGRLNIPVDSQTPGIGLFNIELQRARTLLASAVAYWPAMPHVHLDLVRSTELNAVAFIEGGRNFIGINMGCVILIYDLFCRMLAEPTAFLEIGDASAEKSSPAKLPQLLMDSASLLAVGVAPRGPQDPTRMAYANLMARAALDFLVMHEFAHLLHGHVRLCNEVGSVRLLSERRWDASTGLTPIMSQALEMDADDFAASQGLATLFARVANPSQIGDLFKPFYSSPSAALQGWMRAVYGLFRLFGSDYRDVTLFSDMSHPPPRMRQTLILASITARLRDAGHEDLIRDHVESPEDLFQNVEDVLDSIVESTLDLNDIRVANDEKGVKHALMVFDEWENIQPLLAPLRYDEKSLSV